MWFSRHEPEFSARVRTWVGLKDYVLWSLTGTLVTELSSASATGLLDIARREWHAGVLDPRSFLGSRQKVDPHPGCEVG